MWTSLRVLMLKSDFLQGRRRTRIFNRLSMWITNFKILSIYLMLWILYMIKILLINSFVMYYKRNFICLFLFFILFRVKMSWNIGDNRNLFLKLKSKLVLSHVVLSTPKTSPKKLTLTVVEKQHLPNIEKADSKEEICCLKWTIYIGRR